MTAKNAQIIGPSLLLILSIILFIDLTSAEGQQIEARIDWTALYTGESYNYTEEPIAMLLDSQDNIIVTGRRRPYFEFPHNDILTVKYDKHGQLLFSSLYAGPFNNNDEATALYVHSDDTIYVSGKSMSSDGSYDIVVIKYSSTGDQLWASRFNGQGNLDDIPSSIVVDVSGNAYVVGKSKNLDTEFDLLCLKYDPDGNLVWSATYNSSENGDEEAANLVVASDYSVYVTGKTKGSSTGSDVLTIKYDSYGNLVWANSYNGLLNGDDWGVDVAVDPSGNVYVGGTSTEVSTGWGIYDITLLKYDSDGNQLWMRYYHDDFGQGSDVFTDMEIDNEGNVYVTGTSWRYAAALDPVIIKYDTDGNRLWVNFAHFFGDDEYSVDLALDTQGNVILTGFYWYRGDGGRKIGTVKYDNSGNRIWGTNYTVQWWAIPCSVAVDKQQNVYVAGLGDRNNNDFLIIKYTEGLSNQPPVLPSIGGKSISEGQLLEFGVTATDPDTSDSLTLAVSNLPTGATFTSTPGNPASGLFRWTPSFDQAGAYPNIIFTATDNANPPASVSEAITIAVGDVNRPPVISPIGNKVVNENQTIQFAVEGADPDGDALTFSAGNLPSGAFFNSTTSTFIWTPTFEQAGNYQSIIFTVTDNRVPPASASEEITITVSNVNRPPVLSPIGGKVVNEGQTVTFTVTATDPDGDQLIYSASNLPPGATFDPITQVFSWAPTFDQAGTYPDVEFTVTDNWQPPELAVELITITAGNVNRAPVFTPVGVKSVNEWDTLQFSVSATDYDGDEITYWTSTPLPAGATFDSVTRLFTWTPVGNQTGSYIVVFYATDNDPQDPKTGQLEVVISVSVPTPLDLGKDIEDSILVINIPTEVFNSYWANIKKVRPFIQQGNFNPAVNQLTAFIGKVEADIVQGKINQADGNLLIAMAAELIELLGY